TLTLSAHLQRASPPPPTQATTALDRGRSPLPAGSYHCPRAGTVHTGGGSTSVASAHKRPAYKRHSCSRSPLWAIALLVALAAFGRPYRGLAITGHPFKWLDHGCTPLQGA
ncbi:hypothetical protein GW17_00061625, partial [Ensete ventricosum]